MVAVEAFDGLRNRVGLAGGGGFKGVVLTEDALDPLCNDSKSLDADPLADGANGAAACLGVGSSLKSMRSSEADST